MSGKKRLTHKNHHTKKKIHSKGLFILGALLLIALWGYSYYSTPSTNSESYGLNEEASVEGGETATDTQQPTANSHWWSSWFSKKTPTETPEMSLDATPELLKENISYKIQNNDTLEKAFNRLNLTNAYLISVLGQLKEKNVDVKAIRPDTEIIVEKIISPDEPLNNAITSIVIKLPKGYILSINYTEPMPPSQVGNNTIFTGVETTETVNFNDANIDLNAILNGTLDLEKNKYNYHKGVITSSLYIDMDNAGIQAGVIQNMITLFSYSVDFERDIQTGDQFELITENAFDAKTKAFQKIILYAKLTTRGKDEVLYRFQRKIGADYFYETGEALKRMLMKTPVARGRLSSKFGVRKHPVLGFNRVHKGIDFAAPTGTPIYASGNGTVIFAGVNKGYGKQITLQHGNNIRTLYGHLSKIKTNKGVRVSQGDIIGFVGTTGLSTGPHLHYEVHVNGQAVNPLNLKLAATVEKITKKEQIDFNNVVANIKKLLGDLTATTTQDNPNHN